MNSQGRPWSDSTLIVVVIVGMILAAGLGYYAATMVKPAPPAAPKTSALVNQYTSGNTGGITGQYGTGITAVPSNVTADNYTAPTAWTHIGIIKTADPEEDTFYPLWERRISPQYDLFQYMAIATDRNNIRLPLPDSRFLETGTDIGYIKGLEARGTWVVDRYSNTRWAYTM